SRSGDRGGGVFLRLLQRGGTLLRLLAGKRLGRIVAGFALGDAGLVEEAGDAVGGHRAVAEPVPDAVGVDLDALGVLRQQRVPRAELLDEPAVARAAHVGNDDVVVRTLLGARSGQTNLQ